MRPTVTGTDAGALQHAAFLRMAPNVAFHALAGNGLRRSHMDAIAKTESAQQSAREMLRHEFGLVSAFVRVPALAKVLGLAECTIYQAIREGRFFLPHRMLLSSPAVKLDDVIEWYCSNAADRRPPKPPAGAEMEPQRVAEIRSAVVSKALARMRR